MTHRLPDRLSDTVRAELVRLGGAPAGAGDISELTRAWPRCVGPAIAANAWPARFTRDGSLIVHASSSTWAFELAQLEPTIRERLGRLSPASLKFVLGPLPEPEEPVSRLQDFAHKATPEAVAAGAELAAEIEDPGLRALVAKAAALSLANALEAAGPTGTSGRLAET